MRMAFFLFLFFCARQAHAAGLSITEIMFDPAGTDDKREWVEVYNGGSAPLDLSGHFILTDGPSSSKHALAAQGSSILAPGAHAVIVQDVAGFKNDFSSYAGLIFDSSWSGLTATSGKNILIIDPQSVPLDSVAYDPTIGAANTGDSLQKNSAGAWIAALPTPGAATNGQSSGTGTTDDDDSSDTGTGNPPAQGTSYVGGIQANASSGTKVVPAPSKPHAEIILPSRAVAGIPFKLSVRAYDAEDSLRILGSTHVAFGDGSSGEGKAMETFTHAYAYAGTYVVVLEYRGNPYSPDPDMTARGSIEVSEPGAAIASVLPDGTIQLANESSREADISRWMLAPRGNAFAAETFKLPSGTILLAGKKISLSPKLTGFSFGQAQSVRLLLPSGEPATPISEVLVAESVLPESQTDHLPAVETVQEEESAALLPESVLQADPLPVSESAVSQALALRALSGEQGARASTQDRPIVHFVFGLVVLLATVGLGLWKLGVFKNDARGPVANEFESEDIEEEQPELSSRDGVRILE